MSEPNSPPTEPPPGATPAPPHPDGRTGLPETPPLVNEVRDHAEGLKLDDVGEDSVDRRLAEIEMIGEEAAVGWKPTPHSPLAPEVRYLHISRTINQLITDRNRSVGIFLGVASLLFAASTALLNARADVVPILPLKTIQYWCLPVTFGTLAVIGLFMCLILLRTRIGLIYEVTKMNALLGLPSERVKRVNPLSIFFLMYLMVSLLGAACAGLTTGMLVLHRRLPDLRDANPALEPSRLAAGEATGPILQGGVVGAVYLALFLGMYYWMVLQSTSDTKLEKARA